MYIYLENFVVRIYSNIIHTVYFNTLKIFKSIDKDKIDIIFYKSLIVTHNFLPRK